MIRTEPFCQSAPGGRAAKNANSLRYNIHIIIVVAAKPILPEHELSRERFFWLVRIAKLYLFYFSCTFI